MSEGYTAVQVLGDGAYGRVELMRERRPGGRLVCVKVLHPTTARAVATNELRLMRRLRHPNLVRLHAAIDNWRGARGRTALVMAYYPGGDLRRLLRLPGPRTSPTRAAASISEDRVWAWAVQLALALHYLHDDQRVLHRDLKAANVFLGNDGFLVLGDFGIAREAPTPARTLIGSPLYMAPEVWAGEPYGPPADLWALGCVLFEVCSGGRPPFEAPSVPALVRRIAHAGAAPSPASRLDAGRWSSQLRELIAGLLNSDPRARPTAATILRDPANAAHLRRYLTDRRRMPHSAEDVAILERQCAALGLVLAHGSSMPTPTTMPIRPKGDEEERRLEAARDRDRHELLRVALGRLEELRRQRLQRPPQQSPADAPVAADAMGCTSSKTIGDSRGEQRRRRRASDVVAEWRDPVQSRAASEDAPRRPLSGARGDFPKCSRGSDSFAGIPRQGVVPLTPHARIFAAARSPLCGDVRVLRKHESTRAAARYRARLDETFNRRSGQDEAEEEERKAAKAAATHGRRPSATTAAAPDTDAGGGDDDDPDVDAEAAAVDACVAEIEAVLRSSSIMGS